MRTFVRVSSRHSLSISLAALAIASGLVATPTAAGSGDLAAGLLGGLAVGTLVGSAAAQPRYYVPYYVPPPVYVLAPHCWFERQHVWDGFGYVVEHVRVCG